MSRYALAAILAVGLAACADRPADELHQADRETPHVDGDKTAKGSEGTSEPSASTDAASATDFITPGANVPESAERDENGVPRDDHGRPFDYMYLGREIPDFRGTMVAGSLFSTPELENQWTLIEVWGLWCHESIADVPYVAELWNRIKSSDEFAFLSIHTPPNAERADDAYGRHGSLETFFEEKAFSYPTLRDEDASIRETLEISWTPSYILVAPDLTVQGFRTELAASDADDPVQELLDDIAEVKASYEPGASRPVED
jgi:hypothetical protein